MKNFHTISDVIPKLEPVKSAPRTLVAAHWILGASVFFFLLFMMCAALGETHPPLRHGMRAAGIILHSLGLALLAAWGALNAWILGELLWRSNFHLAAQLDAQIAHDRKLIDGLVKANTLPNLQRLRRHVDFETKMIQGFGVTVAQIGGLGAALIATAAFPQIYAGNLSEYIKISISVLVLGTLLAGAVKHGFGQRLRRLEFTISEAELELDKKKAKFSERKARHRAPLKSSPKA
ncbi:hypothetical protein ACLIMP_00070 [Novosphingobium aerophilum]|uniref:hypothetical protein n=1 Tax=Novosphingobium aerophilum TaxID=2839843 RepID=UPI003FD29DB2